MYIYRVFNNNVSLNITILLKFPYISITIRDKGHRRHFKNNIALTLYEERLN